MNKIINFITKTIHLNLFFVLTFILLFLVSCGVIIDTGKITGSWTLEETEYYIYNEVTDTYITLYGSKDQSSDFNTPMYGGFFYDSSNDIIISFEENGEFSVTKKSKTDSTPIYIIQKASAKWSLDTYENTVTLSVSEEIREDYKNTHDIWSKGFSLKNSWPLPDLESMELIINASDINKDLIDVHNTNYKAKSMKGFFKKI